MPSFIHFGFLAAGLAVGLPILIHLMFRQRARTISIGSVRFLQQALRQHQRRRRLRQLLLLALRCLAILLLALLFARPYWDSRYRDALEREVVVLVDRSASMATVDARGRSSITNAWLAARRVMAGIDDNVVVHLALCDAAGVEVIAAETVAQRVPPASEAATDFGLALAWARDVFSASTRTDQRIVLMTDLQRSGAGKTPLDGLSQSLQVDVVDVGQAIVEDLALTSVGVVRSELRPQVPILLSLLVRNNGPAPVAQVELRLRLEGPTGVVESQRQIDMPAAGVVRIEWPLELIDEGLYGGHVEIAPRDAAAWNNRRYVAFDARPPDRLLLVDGDEGRAVYGNETYYLETALRLAPPPGVATARSFEVERLVWETGSGFPRLDGFQAILLCNVRRLRDVDVERLVAYASAGGQVWIFAGDKLEPESLDALAQSGLFPGQIARRPDTASARVTSWHKEHPALAPFTDPQRGDLRRLDFEKIWPIDKLSANAESLLVAGEHIVAAQRPLGSGRCVYFGWTADRDWTDWPQSRLYVPLVRQFAAYLTGQLAARPKVQEKLVERAGQRPGLDQQAEQVVVRNVDSHEMIPDRLTEEQFRELLGLPALALSSEEKAARADLTLPPNMSRPDELWTSVLWILLGVLAVETLLASRVHA